jgi:uncharacterized repeat protein (TIGR03803 family)
MKMKHCILFLALLALLSVGSAQAQQLTTLHSFNSADGYLPFAGLTLGNDGNFYGVTEHGGDFAGGAAFRITPSGSFTLLHSFGQSSTDPQHPHATLIKGNDGNFYGVTVHGGTSGNGTVYKMSPDGQVTVIHSMALSEGTHPDGPLLLAPDGNFYGTAPQGGGSGGAGSGTVFKMTPDGTLTVLHSFSGTFGGANNDGADPEAGLTLGSDGNLYGTTAGGGTSAQGTAFVVTTSGSFTTIHTFASDSQNLGAHPVGNLTLGSDNSFYGTCANDVVSGNGIIFKMSTSGTVQTLYHFLNSTSDGAAPHGTLFLGSDGNFYGTASGGGAAGAGSIFKITPAGVFTLLYSFTGNQTNSTDGANPWAGVVQGSDGGLYGTTTAGGGSNNAGTVFKFGAAVAPPAAHISVTYEGKIRDRVGQGDAALKPDGTNDATFTIQLKAGSGTRQVTSLDINRGDGNEWDTIPNNGKWVVGAAANLDGDLLNAANGAVNFVLDDGVSFSIFAADNGDKFSGGQTFTVTVGFADGTTAAASVTLPPTNALSPTTFTVNESNQPSYPPTGTTVNGLADTVLRFAAHQIGNPAGLTVRVQATTTPDVQSSWTNLPTAKDGKMSFDQSTNRFILNTTDYQYTHTDPVYFRAVSFAQAQTPSISNVVGPFNLTSNTQRLTTRLNFVGGGNISDLYFWTNESAMPSGIAARVQASFTPSVESSWIDLKDEAGNNISGMTRSTGKENPNCFLLLINQYPTSQGIYFRVIANAPGYVDSLSNIMGPYDITADTPPVVAVFPPQGSQGSGDGHDANHPVIISAGSSSFGAVAHSSRTIKKVQLLIDGAVVADYPGEADQNTLYPVNFTATPGDHVLEAVAADDLGATARAATSATYLRVIPPSGSGATSSTKVKAELNGLPSGRAFTVAQSGGDWSSPSTWMDLNGQPGVPGETDLAIIGSNTVHLDKDIGVESLSISSGGTLTSGVGANLVVFGTITIYGGTFNNCDLVLSAGAVCEMLNAGDTQWVGSVTNNGTWRFHGSGGIRGLAMFSGTGTVEWLPAVQIPPNAATDPLASLRILQATQVTNAGLITGTISALIGHDGGSLIGHDGGSLIGHDGGSLIGDHGSELIGDHGSEVISHDGGTLIGQDGSSLIAAGGGNLIATGGGNFKTSADAPSAPTATGFTQTGGAFDLGVANISGPVTLNAGVINGSGIIGGDLTNNGGFITPGKQSAGTIAVTGNFSQAANGSIVIERDGPMPTQFDQLQIDGTANLAGKLDVKTMNGYTPSVSDTFDPLGYSSASGSLSVSSNAQVTMNATGVVASVDPSKPNPAAGQPLNISTRMQVLAGDNALIAGFIVTGPSGSTKKVLIRGLGPSLANFGVPGTLSDPLLELHKADGTVVSNDNWQQGDTSQIPNGFAPSDPRESLIVATLSPGNYSAVVKGAHGETGVGIAEVYDLDSASTAQLANISTRGFVNTGDNVMIGGFIIGGSEPAKILVRAIGPSLTAFGVQGALPATTLELHDANGAVISNDGWRSTQEAEIIATTIPPSNDNEAAILATLVPGNYTAVVRGKDNTTGIGLVEAYNLQ